MTVSQEKSLPPAGSVYAIGNFDGVHPGHRRLFDICRDIACETRCAVCALTFCGLEKYGGRLITTNDRDRLLRDAGADFVIEVEFESIRDMSPEDFVLGYLADGLKPSAVVCGEDFRFGKGAAGDALLLGELLRGRGIALHTAETVKMDGVAVSTSGVKAAMAVGDARLAAKLLGRRYSFEYTVEEGKRLGRTIGAPTINQHFPKGMFIPKFGVYAGDVSVDGTVYPCVTNIGIRPTVDDGDAVTAESYIIGYEGDLYGKNVRVNLTEYLREEMKFDSVDALGEQIARDADAAKRVFEK